MKIVCLVVILSVICSGAFAIRCYECDSSKDTACGLGGVFAFTQSVKDCSQGGFGSDLLPHKCFKLTAKDSSNNEYVQRGCMVSTGPVNSCDFIAKTIGFLSSKDGVHDLNCEMCETDKCNSAVSATATMAVVSVVAACILFLF